MTLESYFDTSSYLVHVYIYDSLVRVVRVRDYVCIMNTGASCIMYYTVGTYYYLFILYIYYVFCISLPWLHCSLAEKVKKRMDQETLWP